jgi:hypothetical protein
MKKHWKAVLIVLAIGGVSFVAYSIYKTVKAGISDITGAPKAIWNGIVNDASVAWNSVTGLFSGSLSKAANPPAVTDAQTAGINSPNGQPITADNAAASLLLPATNSVNTLPANWNWQAYE